MGVGYLTGQGGAGFPGPWKEKASGEVFGNAIAKNDPVVLGRYGSWDTAIDKIPDISGLTGYVVGVTHYGDFMALATSGTSTHEMEVYKRTGINDGFSLLTTPTGVGTASPYDIEFTKDGNFLAIGLGSTPYFKVFSRSGDVFTLLSNPATLPTASVVDLAFSNDGVYLALATGNAVMIYKKSGSVYNYLSSITSVFTDASGVSFSADGVYLSVVGSSSPYVKIYKRTGDTFTLLSNPGTLPTGAGLDCCFSPDGNYLAVIHSTTPWMTIYKRSGDTFTKLANPTTLPGGNPSAFNSCQFDPSSTYLIFTIQATSPYIFIYKVVSDVFTKLANPSSIPVSNTYGCTLSDDALYLSLGMASGPYMINYRTTAKDIISKVSHFQTNPLSWLPNNDNLGVAMQGGAVGETIRVNLFPALNNI